MTKLEKILSSIRRERSEYVPVAPFLGGFVFNNSGYPWSDLFEAPSLYVENEVKWFREFDYDAVWGPSLDETGPFLGATLRLRKDGPPTIEKPPILMRSDLARVKELGKCLSESKWIRYKLEIVKELRREVGFDIPIITHGNNPFRLAGNLVGLENLFVLMINDSIFVHDLLDTCLNICIEANRLLMEGQTDILWTGQPTASANCISRNHYKEFVFPRNKILFQEIKRTGKYVIMHACGRWEDRFDLAIEEGADMLHLDGVDLALFWTFGEGRVSIMGQVPSGVLLEGTPEEVTFHARRDIENGGKKGGMILGGSCSLPPGTPAANIRALVQVAREHGTQARIN